MAKSRYRTPQTTGALVQPLPQASAAVIDGSAFISVTPTDPIPVTWDERARRAWTYYIEEPLVKNCVNSWRCFAVGDEIKLANDRLRYAYHAARAIVENDDTRISSEELNALLQPNGKAASFVRDNFKGLFFANGVHAIIDQVRANIDALSGYKKDIALFALGKTCMSGKGGFGHFSSSTDYGKRQDTPDEFKQRFAKNVARINALVFSNGKDCTRRPEATLRWMSRISGSVPFLVPWVHCRTTPPASRGR